MEWTYNLYEGDGIPCGFLLGNVEIRFYAICILIGMVLAVYLSLKEATKIGVDKDNLYNGAIIGIILGIIGARVYYILFNLDYYLQDIGRMFDIRSGGLAIHGGIIAAVVFTIFYCRKKEMNLWKTLDIVAPALLIGQICGRWGNFFNQEAHGGEVEYSFLKNTLHLPNFIVNNMGFFDEYGYFAYWHPTFLYESTWNLIGLIAIFIIRRKRVLKIGDIMPLYLCWYSLGRFFIEWTRTDSLMIFGIKQNQLISVLLFIGGIAFYIFKRRKFNNLPYYVDEIIPVHEEGQEPTSNTENSNEQHSINQTETVEQQPELTVIGEENATN